MKADFFKGKVKKDILNIVAFNVDIHTQTLYYLVQIAPYEVKRFTISLSKAKELGIINLDPIAKLHDPHK